MFPKVDIPQISAAELKAMLEGMEPVTVVDVRDDKDGEAGRIEVSLNIVLVELMARFQEIPKGKKIVIVDLHGKQTLVTGRYLVSKGYTDIVRLDKGMKAGWIDAGYPVVK